MLNNVGFMNHPTDCTQFVQCYYGSSGGIVAVYQQCPFGLYWSQQYLTCIPAKDVDCPVGKQIYICVYSEHHREENLAVKDFIQMYSLIEHILNTTKTFIALR